MKSKLENLLVFLSKRSLEKEAKRIRFLLKIAAPPMEDIFTLPSVYREYDEESDEETWSDEEPVKDPYYVGSNKSEDWYKSIQAMGNSVIMIPFDANSLDEDDIAALSYVFGGYYEDADSLIKNTNSFSYESESKHGDRQQLKVMFPNLWSKIQGTLSQKNLKEEDVIYLLVDETESQRPNVDLSPEFFSHDIGHIEADFGEDPTLTDSVYSFLYEAASAYINKESGERLKEAISDDYDEEFYDRDEIVNLISYFFPSNVFSGDPMDEVNDVISSALEGRLKVDVPSEVDFDKETFVLEEEKIDSLMRVVKEFRESFLKLISSKGNPENKYEYQGVLGDSKGKVILYSVQ